MPAQHVDTKRHTEYAHKYLYEAMKYKPDATPQELRREVRRRLRQDGHGSSWLFVLKIIMALLPLLFRSTKK